MSLLLLGSARRRVRASAWAELPRAGYAPAFALPGGSIRTVTSGGDVQAALNAAQPGDVVSLETGATFVGSFTLPVKSGSAPIYVVASSVLGGGFPVAPGTRATSSAGMARLRHPTGGAQPALDVASGARSGWRMVGIEIDMPSAPLTNQVPIVRLGNRTLVDGGPRAALPAQLVLDRCRVLSRQSFSVRRGIEVAAEQVGILDCEVRDVWTPRGDEDSQSVWITPFARVVTIRNTGTDAASMGVLLGAIVGTLDGVDCVAEDVTIVQHGHQLLPWQDPTDPAWTGIVYQTKNAVETKGGRRLLVDRITVRRHIGVDSQYPIVIKDDGARSPCSDVTVQQVDVRDGMGLLQVNGLVAGGLQRVVMRDLMLRRSRGDSNRRVLSIGGFAEQVALDRLTGIMTQPTTAASSITADPGRVRDLRITNSIIGGADFGMTIPGNVDGGIPLTVDGERTLSRVAVIGRNAAQYPTNGIAPMPATPAAVGFERWADAEDDDLRLASASPLRGLALDGGDLGADAARIIPATAGCLSGTWS